MEGVKRYCVRLLNHNEKWTEEFQKVKQSILEQWTDNVLDIQHVGSTAVHLICAKPILDVAVQLQSVQQMEPSLLEALGYDYCGIQHRNPLHHLFVLRGPGEISLQHIHCYDQRDPDFNRIVGFRDYLNTHPDAARQYETLKKDLAKKYPDDRIAYTNGKEHFIRSICEKCGL